MTKNNSRYTKRIHDDVKEWVAANIERWRIDGEDWFKIEKIPDEFIPTEILEEEREILKIRRKRSTATLSSTRELLAGLVVVERSHRHHPDMLLKSLRYDGKQVSVVEE